MARIACSALLVLAALAAANAAPSSPWSLHRAANDSAVPLADLAAQRGLALPPRPLQANNNKTPVDDKATGAQAYPFGMADPQPPQRSRPGKAAGAARAKRAADDIYDETKLPTNVVPTRYTVTMAPNLDSGVFYGSTDIYINVVEATKRIILHAAPDISYVAGEDRVQILKCPTAEQDCVANGKASLVPLSLYEDLERIVVDLENELEVGQHYLLRFPLFAAYLRTDLKGFYLSSYKDDADRTRLLATTQFEPPATRFAFPCFDEPALKARFKIFVEHDMNLFARSNMPQVSRTQTSMTIVRTEFQDTLPMSTYLLAWVVSDFGGLAASNPLNTVTTWGRKNLITETTAFLANLAGPEALRRLGDWTGIPYALPKADQYAIPDFDAGAMENWGLVTYREEYLLETEATTIRIREYIATTVCHELGHQWTGDLVTLDWWSNTWLNEAFATYFENVICDEIFPEWNLMDKYVTDNVHVGMANDVLANQVAMSSPAFGTAAIDAKFDRITYKKGGSVLRMFEHVIGTAVFKKAMNVYLSANSYKSGSPDRLFSAMNAEVAQLSSSPLPAGTDFATMAKTWTEQAGVPVVTVTRDTAQGTVSVSHERFFYETPEDADATLWYVPIPPIVNAQTKVWTQTAPANWLTPDAPTKVIQDTTAAADWIAVNPRQIGYYLVNYDQANWKLLHAALTADQTTFPAATRTQLLHDALALARAGRLDYATALPFLQALKVERSPAAWKAGVEALAFLRDRLALSPASAALKAFIGQLTTDAYTAVGLGPAAAPSSLGDTSKDEERYLRYFVASYACYAGVQKCISDAVDAVINMNGDSPVSPNADVKDAALCYGVANSQQAFDWAIERYMMTYDAKERATFAAALGCVKDHATLETLLDGIMAGQDDTSLNAADLQQLINAVLSRWDNHRFMLDYYMKNHEKIRAFTMNSFYISMLNALIGDIRDASEIQEVTAFVNTAFPHHSSAARQEFDLRLEAASNNLAWNTKYYAEVSQWLYQATGTGPVDPTTTRPASSTAAPTTPRSTQRPTGAPTAAPTSAPTAAPTTPSPSGAARTTGVAALLAATVLALLLLR